MVTIHTTSQGLKSLHFVSLVSSSKRGSSPSLLVVASPVSCLQSLPHLAVGFVYLAIWRRPASRLLSIYFSAFQQDLWLGDFLPDFVLLSDIRSTCPAHCNPFPHIYLTRSVSAHLFTVCQHVQSHTAHSFLVYYLATNFDLKWRSSSGHCTVTWMHSVTKRHKPFYVKIR